ncbi:MAG: GTP-dependent dephospho-CoA kinase family protein [Methanomassiliicoccaceae archaeon]|nr:GTP-dependent dephospho-CoA kinase family protein [Methanomassiliicoccaceae archaeon]
MEAVSRKVPERNRELFKEPLGRDLKEEELKVIDKKSKMITVGDVVSLTVVKQGVVPDLSIYDGMTERKEMTEFAALVKNEGWGETAVKNEAGTITAELITAIRNALNGNKEIIRVEGEEDLAVIPCMLLSPEGTNIIYGWPGKGMKLIVTDENIRKKAQYLLEMTEELE